MNKTRVLLADDHSIVRMGLKTLLEMDRGIEVAGQAVNGRNAVEETRRLKPDVVVMDLMMPVMDGAAATAAIKADSPEIKIIIFTTFPTSDLISRALDNGATGAIFKSDADIELLNAIHAVAAGKVYISAGIKSLIASDPPIPPLAPRQTEILESIVRGLSNAEIATQLGISSQVVREHTIAIFKKIGAANRTEAVAIAMRNMLLSLRS